MADKLSPDAAAARPWFVVEPPFNEGAPWINAGSPDPHGGEFVCDLAWPHEFEAPENVARTASNAALIVQAVNEREELLAERDRYRSALNQIVHQATNLPHARRIDRDTMRQLAREALDGD